MHSTLYVLYSIEFFEVYKIYKRIYYNIIYLLYTLIFLYIIVLSRRLIFKFIGFQYVWNKLSFFFIIVYYDFTITPVR